MFAATLLLAAPALAITPPNCARQTAIRSADPAERRVPHVFQNGERQPLRLWWVDPQGKRVDLATIAPGGYHSVNTYVGHAFVLTDPAGRCRRAVRADDTVGTYVGTSRYRDVAVRPGWHVLVDRALPPRGRTARSALATLARLMAEAETALPPASLAQVRTTPIFLQDHAGHGSMFHRDPDWLVAHGRTVEMLFGIELTDAGEFVDTVTSQPGALLHELAHALFFRLSDADRIEIDAAYRSAMARGLYRNVKRWDGSTGPAYAIQDSAEYFAELSEAHFLRNDFFPFDRSELTAYDPAGERLVARFWR